VTLPLKYALLNNGMIRITGGAIGGFEKSISGLNIPPDSELMEVEDVVKEHLNYEDYQLNDLDFLQWEYWGEILRFATIPEVTEYIISPMIEAGTSHNRWQDNSE